ncbi:MAG: ATP-binding cassette domain-containing protein, partial [Rubellimicrobium sp.]|nr:ATP-binding cassette domain-containing protein [Rubellimicrobium sp.]
MTGPAVRIEGLSVAYRGEGGWARVLHGVDLAIAPGEVLGLVGESGCGKSTLGLQVMGWRAPGPRPAARGDGGAGGALSPPPPPAHPP